MVGVLRRCRRPEHTVLGDGAGQRGGGMGVARWLLSSSWPLMIDARCATSPASIRVATS